ncbi:MAG: uroporphyrinogen-III C-methyltransferase [Gemmatimonadetes bacterium]|nr:uroporphyrinogen-III C-methyltransferase [Gemmatimonadota bacterium]
MSIIVVGPAGPLVLSGEDALDLSVDFEEPEPSADGTRPGTVYLVGAGPGDPGLITVRGVECLHRADIVLYDYLANAELLEHASPSAKLVPLGRQRGGRMFTPAEIAERMIAEARAGRSVVRLKGGDPSVFGRGADETEALRNAGIPFEIVPGITSGLALAAYCELPITQQHDASAVALVTGRERDDKTESCLDYDSLASFPGTLIFYMGVGRCKDWSRELLARGRSPDTPVAIVRHCTRSDQQMVRCTLGTVAEVVATLKVRPPALFAVGEVVDRAPRDSWFSSRPLFGTQVLVPGSRMTSARLRGRLTALGADVLAAPVLRIGPPADWEPVDRVLDRIHEYDWLVFTSEYGVDQFLGRLMTRGGDARRLGSAKLAALGSGTAERLIRWGLRADLVPEESASRTLAETLLDHVRGRWVLLVQANRGREALARELEGGGARLEQVAAYESTDELVPDPDVVAALASGEIQWVAVTSSAAARALVHLYGDDLRYPRLASIGPVTTAALKESGLQPAVEASPHTTQALVEAILAEVAPGHVAQPPAGVAAGRLGD